MGREFELIDAIRKRLARRSERVLRGPGDDAAVVRGDGVTVTSVDAFVEGVHFRLATTSLRDLGWKCLAASLSDLAACGARAGEAYLVLGLPESVGEREALELVDGAEELADSVSVTICGGDLTASNELFVAVTVVGHAPSEGNLVSRDGAQAGDVVGVTGTIGGAGAGLILLERKQHGVPIEIGERLLERHRRPRPRLEEGAALAAVGATAMIDVSDGLASDAMRLSESSGVQLAIGLDQLPLEEGVDEVAELGGATGTNLAATAGEDYELLFTVPPERRTSVEESLGRTGTPVAWIGEVLAGGGVRLLDGRGRPQALSGWDHFASRTRPDRPRRAPA
jgi:thiamine-monophosphate kinase